MQEYKTWEQRRKEWEALPPVYFPWWAWKKASLHNPVKYQMTLPVYQGNKVMLT